MLLPKVFRSPFCETKKLNKFFQVQNFVNLMGLELAHGNQVGSHQRDLPNHYLN